MEIAHFENYTGHFFAQNRLPPHREIATAEVRFGGYCYYDTRPEELIRQTIVSRSATAEYAISNGQDSVSMLSYGAATKRVTFTLRRDS